MAIKQHINKHKKKYCVLLIVLSVLGLYFLMHTRYRIYDVDDAWFTTFYHNFIKTGYNDTAVFNLKPVQSHPHFGVTQSFVFGHFAEIFGWSKSSMHILSALFLVVAAFIWYRIAKLLQLSEKLSIISSLALLVMPATFWMANFSRPETMVLALVFLIFYMFLKGWYLPAGMLVGIAVETHPMGLVVLFYIFAFLLYNRKEVWADKKRWMGRMLLFSLGGAMGGAYFMAFHLDKFSGENMQAILKLRSLGSKWVFSYILKYFGTRDFYQHIPELLFFGFSVFYFYKHKMHKENRMLNILFLVIILSSIITGRKNRRYMVYLYPVLVTLSFFVWEKMKKLKPALIIMGVYLITLYGAIFAVNHQFDFERITRQTKAAMTDSSLPAVGMGDNWFAAIDRKFYPMHDEIFDVTKLGLKKFYYIRNDYLASHTKAYYKKVRLFVEKNFKQTLVKKIYAYNNQYVQVYLCERKKP